MRVEVSRYIVMDSEVCHGKPVFKGTRVLVSDILELLASGVSVEEVVEEYPGITADMVRDALEYAARLVKGERYVGFAEVPT